MKLINFFISKIMFFIDLLLLKRYGITLMKDKKQLGSIYSLPQSEKKIREAIDFYKKNQTKPFERENNYNINNSKKTDRILYYRLSSSPKPDRLI